MLDMLYLIRKGQHLTDDFILQEGRDVLTVKWDVSTNGEQFDPEYVDESFKKAVWVNSVNKKFEFLFV
jgi:hypothetical protein